MAVIHAYTATCETTTTLADWHAQIQALTDAFAQAVAARQDAFHPQTHTCIRQTLLSLQDAAQHAELAAINAHDAVHGESYDNGTTQNLSPYRS